MKVIHVFGIFAAFLSPIFGGNIKIKPGIIDGAGYAIKNAEFTDQDLVMEANPPPPGETLGTVILQPFVNSISQKWGIAYYGGSTAALSSGIHSENKISVYFPNGSSRPQSRQYSFESTDGNETFKIKNSETKKCLGALPIGTSIVVDFVSCDGSSPHIMWIFQRTG